MQNAKILWADDEIDLLKAHILFLEAKGYKVTSVSNGHDAVDSIHDEQFDLVFLDENMPGMSGLEVLSEIKSIYPHLPVVMITKSEEEGVMEDAIGAKIADYLIKPVNPNQILMSIKKILQNKELVNQKVNTGYQQDFRKIGMMFYEDLNHEDWFEIYRKLTYWDKEMGGIADDSMKDVLVTQISEANTNFGRYVMNNYLDWVNMDRQDGRPLLSPEIISKTAFPALDEGYDSVFFILIDCLRFDQWREFQPLIADYFYIKEEGSYTSILPTATQYARNSIFSGMYPSDLARKYPRYWKNDEEEGGKNQFEAELLQEQIMRHRLNIKHSYHKILRNEQGEDLANNFNNLMNNDLNCIVYNFIDALSHSRTDSKIIRELAPTDAAYRSVSSSWLSHSPLMDLMRKLSERNVKVILTSDHGSVKVNRAIKIIGDRNTTTNIRYKQGKNLNYDTKSKNLFSIRKPEEARLPKTNVSSSYVFTTEDYFFAYPNNYNHYVNYFKDTLQHGGISLEEMVVPLIELVPKR